MIKKFIFYAGILIVFIAGCTTVNKTTSTQQIADKAWAMKDYGAALRAYEQIINEYKQLGKTNECPVYGKAGLAALETGDLSKAVDYLEMDTYTPFATAETYKGQANAYRRIDNLSKEIMALKNYLELFPEGTDNGEIRLQLFDAYVESENWDLAAELWPSIPETAKINTDVLGKWFTVNLNLERNNQCDVLADQLLENNPDYLPAIEWKAYQTFRFAENHYQIEMEAYEKNKTNKQYKKLLDELEKITTEFHVALGFFDKLYSLDPDPKYAGYISNIYVRFDDKEKADYYRKLAGQ